MTNYECIMIGLELGKICMTTQEVSDQTNDMVSAGFATVAEANKVRAVANRMVQIRRTRTGIPPQV